MALIVSLLIGWLMARGVVGPIGQLQRTVDHLSSGDGDLCLRLPEKGKDELSELAHSFNQFIEHLDKNLLPAPGIDCPDGTYVYRCEGSQ